MRTGRSFCHAELEVPGGPAGGSAPERPVPEPGFGGRGRGEAEGQRLEDLSGRQQGGSRQCQRRQGSPRLILSRSPDASAFGSWGHHLMLVRGQVAEQWGLKGEEERGWGEETGKVLSLLSQGKDYLAFFSGNVAG